MSTKFVKAAAGRALVVAALGVACLLAAGGAGATYPGANGRIAFAIDAGPNPASPDIYSVLPDGTGLTRLTYDPAADHCPAYSADGSEIAFCSNRTGTFEIWTMTADGTNERRVTRLGQNSVFPDFSPDGKTIAFTSGVNGSLDVYTVDRATGAVRRLTDADGAFPAYSPDGTRIVFLSRRTGVPQVWLMNANGSNQRQLTFDPAPKDQVPDWSPDGSRIVYQSIGGSPRNGDLWVMDADGGNQHQLTHTPQDEFGPAWSPDGKQIAFVRVLGPTTASRAVYVVNADGSGERFLAGGTRAPAWQPVSAPLDSCAVVACERARGRGR